MTSDAQSAEAPTGPLELRAAGPVVAVSFPSRTIELVVMPYEAETVVEHKGRMIREIVAPGAFDGIERRANRVRVNLDHDPRRPVGRAVSFHPSRKEGLVAELRIARTTLGDETLTLADDGILDASAGFGVMEDGESWPSRAFRRLTRLWLDHVALVSNPAYPGARVLAVREADQRMTGEFPGRPATPNLDQVRALILEDRYRSLG